MGKCAIIGRECPQTSDPKAKVFCPAWDEHGIIFKDKADNDVVKHCVFQCIGPCMMHTVRAANRAAATAESNRNVVQEELQQGFNYIAQTQIALQGAQGYAGKNDAE